MFLMVPLSLSSALALAAEEWFLYLVQRRSRSPSSRCPGRETSSYSAPEVSGLVQNPSVGLPTSPGTQTNADLWSLKS